MDLKSLIAKMDAIEQSAISERVQFDKDGKQLPGLADAIAANQASKQPQLTPQQQAQNVLQPGMNTPAAAPAGAPTTFTPTHFHKNNLGGNIPLMLNSDGKFYWETNGAIQQWQGNTENRSGWNPASVDGEIKDGKFIDYPEGTTWKTAKDAADKQTATDTAALMEKLKTLLALVDQYTKLKTAADQKKANPAEKRTAAQLATTNDLKTANIEEGAIANALLESFGYTNEAAGATAGQQVAAGAAGYGAAKGVGKMLGKAIPGVGLAFGAADAYDRAKKGDYVGAGMAGAAGLASLVPGIGTAAALGLDAANIARDYKAGEFSGAGASTTPVGADPKVVALQKKLIAAGAKITADGKMGPMTQAAMKQFPNIKEGEEMNKQQSVAEGIASLRDRLAMIENQQEQVTDEGVLSNIVAGAKNFGRGLSGQGARTATGTFMKKGASTPNKVGQAIKASPVKTALGGAAAGAGLGLALGGSGGAGASTTPVKGPAKPAAPEVPATPEVDAAGDKELAELKAKIDALVGELGKSQNPEIQKGLADIKAKLGDGSTPPASPTGAQAGAVAPNMAQVNK